MGERRGGFGTPEVLRTIFLLGWDIRAGESGLRGAPNPCSALGRGEGLAFPCSCLNNKIHFPSVLGNNPSQRFLHILTQD